MYELINLLYCDDSSPNEIVSEIVSDNGSVFGFGNGYGYGSGYGYGYGDGKTYEHIFIHKNGYCSAFGFGNGSSRGNWDGSSGEPE